MEIRKEVTNDNSNIKKVIAVMSGKGGVGKSSVTSLVALALSKQGYKVGIMDADITGPSIPKIFGINAERATGDEKSINPVETQNGIKVISLNLLIKEEDSPVIWRGPLLGSTVKQFYTDVNWGELDYLVIDLPPGTGDVSLTVMQSVAVDGIIVVTAPQDLVNLIVKKSINMANMMHIPVMGVIENMSYYECSDCGKRNYIFGKSKLDTIAKEMDLNVIHKIPIDSQFVELCDEGKVELYPEMGFGIFDEFNEQIKELIAEK
jgi:Mrp family chromosome partitioning ATPase